MDIALSEIDSTRFDLVTAKCIVRQTEDLMLVDEWCRQRKVEFVIARVRTSDIQLAQNMENAGFRLMDTLVYFKRDLLPTDSKEIYVPAGYRLDCDGRPNANEMEKTAALAFKNYIGHYHADSSLPVSKSDAVYSSWAFNSAVSTEVANQIIALYSGDSLGESKLAAFATLNYKQSQCEGVLFGVHPGHRQRGLHKVLVRAAIACSVQRGCTSIISSTQLNNLQVQKNWVREGFLPSDSFYTFHQWR
jgi:ribosomal protein S18 acetylase RimI-like enzyme